MQKFDKWMFPDGEEHLPQWMRQTDKRVDGRLAYQYTKYEMALSHVKKRDVAIDIGSHVGLWAWYMARDFKHLACFEPMDEHRMCWRENMKDRNNAELYDYALGDEEKLVNVATRTKGSSGDTGIVSGDGKIQMIKLDKLNFPVVDFIKIDCEGYELNVLNGAIETLQRCKPCVIVEQKGFETTYGHKKRGAVDLLIGMGANLRGEISGDYVLSWNS